MVEGMSVVVNVMLSLMGVMSPPPALVLPIVAHCCEGMHFGCVCFTNKFGFLNYDDICIYIVDNQFEPLEFVFDSVYVDLQYDEISLTSTAGSVSLGCVCSNVIVFGPTLTAIFFNSAPDLLSHIFDSQNKIPCSSIHPF